MPFGMHWSQLLILIALALLIFGPKRLPEVGSAVGKTIREFQKSIRAVTEPEAPPPPTSALTPPAVTPPAQDSAGAVDSDVEARQD
jgi:sec-independent protein translocase protein TatA